VFQGVHMMLQFSSSETGVGRPWAEGEERVNKLVRHDKWGLLLLEVGAPLRVETQPCSCLGEGKGMPTRL